MIHACTVLAADDLELLDAILLPTTPTQRLVATNYPISSAPFIGSVLTSSQEVYTYSIGSITTLLQNIHPVLRADCAFAGNCPELPRGDYSMGIMINSGIPFNEFQRRCIGVVVNYQQRGQKTENPESHGLQHYESIIV